MDTVVVHKHELLAKIKENRKQHREIFEEALEGYRTRAIELLEEHIERISNGKVERVLVSLPFPHDHTKDYDRVIAMLEMEINSEVEIRSSDFAAYVMDDWSWKQDFLTTNAAYSPTAAASLSS